MGKLFTRKEEKNHPTWMNRARRSLENLKIPSRLIFIILGVLSSAWFLIRVIPKPSRAGYPCMKVAAPFMSSFVIWLLGLGVSVMAFKKARVFVKSNKLLLAGLMVLSGLIAGGSFLINSSNFSFAGSNDVDATDHLTANEPMGIPQGVVPGRVVWVHDKDATNENCTNDYGVQSNFSDDDGYFLPQNNDQTVIDKMLFDALTNLADVSNTSDAWDAMFKYFNNKKHGSNDGYTAGENIFIKINTTSASWVADPSTLDHTNDVGNWRWDNYGISETTPATILSVLRQLVDSVGIPEANIYVGDPISHVWQYMYDLCHAEYPDVKYVDGDDYVSLGRTTLISAFDPGIYYSDDTDGDDVPGDVMTSALADEFYFDVDQADYLINLAALKGHERAGITLCAKNHFGTQSRSSAGHLHPGLVAPNNTPVNTGYGQYRVQVDLMGCDYLGQNTLLFLVDGLWGGPHDTKQPVKWQMAPFNNDWPNSFFVSLDQVALESVCFDFLRTEFDGTHTYTELSSTFDYPNYDGTDDYLEQAASSANWPANVTYKPNQKSIPSLGIHEHWYNSTKKVYAGNFYPGHGIELVAIPENLIDETGVSITDPGPPSVPNGIQNINRNNDISIYPIPSNSSINVALSNDLKGNILISVIDISGKEMLSFSSEKEAYDFNQQIDISSLSSGTYFITISNKNYFARNQFVVNK